MHQESNSGAAHGGVTGRAYDVDQASFSRWKSHMRLREDLCYEVGTQGGIDPKSTIPLKRRRNVSPTSTKAVKKAVVSVGQLTPAPKMVQKSVKSVGRLTLAPRRCRSQ